MEDPLQEEIERLNKLKRFDGYTLSEKFNTGSAGMRITSLKDRLGKNTAEADAVQHLEQINAGQVPKMTEEQLDKVVEKMLEQILNKVYG